MVSGRDTPNVLITYIHLHRMVILAWQSNIVFSLIRPFLTTVVPSLSSHKMLGIWVHVLYIFLALLKHMPSFVAYAY